MIASDKSQPAVNRISETSGYLPTLDGWRALSILGVMVCHGTYAVFCAGGSHPDPFWYEITRHGAIGVDVFFGLSGFLICTRLLQERRQRGRVDLKQFYIRRCFRILPPYFFYLATVGLLATTGVIAVGGWEYLSCLLFFRNYLPQSEAVGTYTGHFWSLSVEEHFYLLWPFLLVLCGPKRCRSLVVLLVIAVAVWRVAEFRWQFLSRLLPGVGFYPRTDIRLDGLLWGCLAALWFDRPAWRTRLRTCLNPRVWWLLVAAFLACVYYQPPMAMMIQSLLIPMLLLGTVLHPHRLASRFLEASLLRWMGRMSYSLYLWQTMFFVVGHGGESPDLGPFQTLPWNIAPVLCCGALSYYLIERPLIRLGRSVTARMSENRTVPADEDVSSKPGPLIAA